MSLWRAPTLLVPVVDLRPGPNTPSDAMVRTPSRLPRLARHHAGLRHRDRLSLLPVGPGLILTSNAFYD